MQTTKLTRNEVLKEAGDKSAAIFQVEGGYLKLIRKLPDGRSRSIIARLSVRGA